MVKHSWSQDMCFYCSRLDIRELKDGRTVFWCDKRKGKVPDTFIWRKKCRGFLPVQRAASH